ncbi:MAG: helix-turn-helix domain-containing protein, partial [Candidatus Acidiferrales bacterium]
NTIEIHLPPLRERKEDILVLAQYFLRQSAQRYRKALEGFEPVALQVLLDHPWPGNIRELDHSVERAVLLAEGPLVRASDLGLRPARDASLKIDEMSIEEVERVLIQKALARHGGNVSHASKALGLSRSALYRRLQKYSL